MIPQAAPSRRIARFRADVDAAIARVVGSESYVRGAEVDAFEREFAAYCDVDFSVGVASGTDALALALRACGVGPGDEVVTTALTAPATAQAICHIGAVPRFADVDPTSRCLDPSAVASAIGPRTRAIVPVHLFGHACDMPALMDLASRHDLIVVEDCAQSQGATLNGRKLGTFGHAAAYSFYPTKNLGCIGDGGAVVSDDRRIADAVRSLGNYGYGANDRISRRIGTNSRLDEMQAAILRTLLPHLDAAIAERREIAAAYRERLGPNVVCPDDDDGCVYHQFAVTCADRDGLMRHLSHDGIGTAVHYAPTLHRHPAFAVDDAPALPITERLSAELLSLPIQPEIAFDAVDTIAASLAGFQARCPA